MTTNLTPKIGQYVYDTYSRRKRKVQGITCEGRLFFIGPEHEPVSRNEFIFPLPKFKVIGKIDI